MAIVLEAITHVSFAGRIIKPGEVFSADNEYGGKLIKGGSAKVIKSVAKTPDKSTPDPNEVLTKTFMALKLEELKGLAIQNNVELLPEDDTKAEITVKLIAAGVTLDENI